MSKSQKVTKEDVLKIAELAQLTLSEEELPVFTEQFNKILDHMDQLNELDTDNIEPLSHVLDLVNATRKDEPQPSLDQEAVLKLAPQSKDGHVAVPPVIQKTEKGSSQGPQSASFRPASIPLDSPERYLPPSTKSRWLP